MKIRTASIVIYKQSDTIAMVQEQHIFNYPETKFDFKISQVETDIPNACVVKIYGVSRDTYNKFKAPKKADYINNQYVIISFGYDRDEEVVYSGFIDRTVYSFDNGNQSLTLLLSKDINKFKNMNGSISSNGKVTLGTALDLIGKAYSYDMIVGKDVNKNLSIDKVSYSGNVDGALKDILSEKYNYYIGQDTIRVFSTDKKLSIEIEISIDSGLLRYPTEDSSGKKLSIRSILLASIESGAVIKIPIDSSGEYTTQYTKRYRYFTVGRYSSSFSNGLGTTEMECEENDK